ncbi:MAG: DNA-directed RNA polymerase subunit alpha [Candidatus Pacebacteria bacterium]|nr:DNA-directed RNA polymerase subunit alpha [Candidatus Paceibacterota bacterium]
MSIINDLVFPEKPKPILYEEKKATFEIKPLFPGFGVTLGNALRRVLLSSLLGSAITKVRIEGVEHEFSTLPGVYEDILDILLNLKKIRIKMDLDYPVELKLEAKGKKEIKAKDIEKVAGVEIVNPEVHIATLTSEDAELKMYLTVEKGRGYVLSENLSKEKPKIGELYLDANFSPVVNVSYEVENVRYLERTDFDLLRITVETDGTKSPVEAINEAIEILINYFETLKIKE